MKSKAISWIVLGLAAFLISGCKSNGKSEGEVPMSIQITSPSFSEGGTIPRKFTCDGEDVSPQLDWKGIPDGAKSLVLIVDDPDALAKTWVHWVLFDLPPDLQGLPEGVSGKGTLGKNDSGKQSYGGPCPPKGPAHRYFFKLYALDTSLALKAGSKKAEVEKAMQGHILAQGQLIGKYGR